MSGTFQLAGTLVGTAFGGPIGGVIGGAIGGLVDQEVFGKAQKGPRLNDFGTTGAAVGAPIIRAYGLNKLAGELIWFGRVREKKKTKKVGGIGGFGGQKVVTYTYFATFAIGLGEGEIKCLRRIKINGRVWWEDPGAAASSPTYLDQLERMIGVGPDALTAEELDQYNETTLKIATSQSRGDNFTFYRGTSDQPVDPTIQSYLGDFAPAYRDTAYVVFTELPVTEYGGALPLIEFEIVSGTGESGQELNVWKAQEILPWVGGGKDPRHPSGGYRYRYTHDVPDDGSAPYRDTLEAAIVDAEEEEGYLIDRELIGYSPYTLYESYDVAPYAAFTPTGDELRLQLHFNRYTEQLIEGGDIRFGALNGGGGDMCSNFPSNEILPGFPRFYWTGIYGGGGHAPIGAGMWQFSAVSDGGGMPAYSPSFLAGPDLNNNCYDMPPQEGYFPAWSMYVDYRIDVERLLVCPLSVCSDKTPLPENPDYCVDSDANVYPPVEFVETTEGTFLQLALYTAAGEEVTQYPLGPVLNLDYAPHVAKNTLEYWEPLYLAAVSAGDIEAGKTFDASGTGGPDTYPRSIATACQAVVAASDYCVASDIYVADVIETECLKRGLTINDIDTSLVTDTLPGYMLPRNISGREAIEQLRTYSWLDAAEIDGVLKFVPRGRTEVATLTLDDMGAHEYGSQRPPALEVTRVDDIQLPKEVRVSYIDLEAELGPGQQYDRRLITDAVNIQQIDLAIAMNGARGKKISTIALYDQWAARKALETALGPRWLALTPTDCVWVPDGDNYVRSRIESIDDALPGLRKLTLVRDEQSLYGREASGPTPQIPDQQPSPAQGPTTLIVLDLPYGAAGNYDDAGYDIAAYGIFASWEGAEIFRSLDGGTTYESVLESSASIAGTVEAPFDGSEMTVKVYGGELLSTTPEAAAAGTNRFAAGVNGRWVIGTFETATPLGDGLYTLSDITYGLFDTMWAITSGSPESFGEAGDAFVMLETVSHVSEEDSVVGQTIHFKAVTAGTAFDNAPTFTLIARGNGRGYVAGFGPPVIPAHSDGATYVAGYSAPGEWTGHDKEIVHDIDGTWVFEQPEDGRQVRNPFGTYIYVAGSPGDWGGIVSNIQLQQSIGELYEQVNGPVDESGLTMNTGRLLGRSSGGAGAVQEIAVGAGLSLSGGTLSASGGGGGSNAPLEAHSASSSPYLDFTAFISSTYDLYAFELINVRPVTSGAHLLMQFGSGGGPTIDAGSNYDHESWSHNQGGGTAASGSAADTSIEVGNTMSNVSTKGLCGKLTLYDPQSTTFHKSVVFAVRFPQSSGNNTGREGAGSWLSTTAATAVRFRMSSGDIADGTIRVYGVAK